MVLSTHPWILDIEFTETLWSRTSIVLMFLIMACAIESLNLPLSCPYQWSDPSIDYWSSCELKHIWQKSLKSSSRMNLNICKNQLKSQSQIILQCLASLSQRASLALLGERGKTQLAQAVWPQVRLTLLVWASQFVSPGSARKNSLTQKPRQQGKESKHIFLFRFSLARLGEAR